MNSKVSALTRAFTFFARKKHILLWENDKWDVVRKKISKFMKNNKVETGLYTITLLCVMELLATGRILVEYDKGGSIKSLLDKNK